MPNEALGLGKNALLGAILCGGASRRMGADKATILLSGNMLWRHVAQRLEPQVAKLIVSIAKSQDNRIFAPYSFVTDQQTSPGPLPAIAQLLQAQSWREYNWWIISSCDTPLQPLDWVEQLVQAADEPGIYFIRCNGQEHYLHALWHRKELASLLEFCQSGGAAVRAFYQLVGAQAVDYPLAESEKCDPFYNINSPDQLALITHV